MIIFLNSWLPSMYLLILHQISQTFLKETDQIWIKKILYLITIDYSWFLLIGESFYKLNNRISVFSWNLPKYLLDTYAPFKKVSKYKLKFKIKSWITTAVQKSISSGHDMLNYRVRQGSVLGPVSFLIHSDDLNHAIKYCKVKYFVDDTNLQPFNRSTKKLNRLVNLDMKIYLFG